MSLKPFTHLGPNVPQDRMLAPKQVAQYREQICERCPMMKRTLFGVRRCTQCHCFIKAKAKLQHEQCPLRYW